MPDQTPLSDADSNRSDDTPSRRAILRGMTVAAGGAAILGSAISPAEAGMPQKAAGYQNTPKGNQSCASCEHFEPPSSCGIVAGKISPHGWCRFYLKKG